MQHDVFISHASDDRQQVITLVEALQAEGLRIWWDEELVAGKSIPEEIEQALNDSSCAVVCWSRAALQRGRRWVRGEAEKARKRGVVISVLLEEVDLPLPFNIEKAVKLTHWSGNRSDEQFCSLVSGIRKSLCPSKTSQSTSERKLALLVGVSTNNFGMPRLDAVKSNVLALESTLTQSQYGFKTKSLIDPERNEIEKELGKFLKGVGRETFVFLYFAGHVLLTAEKGLLLTARDTDLENYIPTTLPLCTIERDYLNRLDGGQVMLVFDACYRRLTETGCQCDLTRDEISAALQTYINPGSISKVLISSGAGSSSAPDSWSEKYSVFTGRLLRGLGVDFNKVDENKDDKLTVGELLTYLDNELSCVDKDSLPLHWDVNLTSANMEFGGSQTTTPILTVEQQDFVSMLAPELKKGKVVPFLGDGIYGTGPLSFSRVSKALAVKAGLRPDTHDSVGIATAAESLELQREDRGELLGELQEILVEQGKLCEPPVAHELVLDLKPPWFVITVNYDDLLERRLMQAGRPYVLVTHVLRSGGSSGGESAGKILIVRSENHPEVKRNSERAAEICMSREVELQPDDCVIYRLLGAPFINELPFAQKNSLDTVVVTETDHIDFLTKLRNPDFGVPKIFASGLFRDKKLLFLEYSLDIWHYRLIGQLFQKTGSGRADNAINLVKSPYVIRAASSRVEERFWKRFSPDRISIDLTMLVHALRGPGRTK